MMLLPSCGKMKYCSVLVVRNHSTYFLPSRVVQVVVVLQQRPTDELQWFVHPYVMNWQPYGQQLVVHVARRSRVHICVHVGTHEAEHFPRLPSHEVVVVVVHVARGSAVN